MTINNVGTAQIQAIISKNSLPNINYLTIYVNSTMKSYTYVDNGSYWTATIFTP